VSGAFFPLVPMEAGGGEEEGFAAPGVQSFDLPPLYEGAPEWLNKYVLMAAVSVILVLLFWLIMARKQRLVPSKGQFIGETAYFFIRNGIARDMIGHDFRRYLPFLIALFSFILVNNLWGVFPLTLLPTASHVGWAYGLAGMVWLLYNGVGIAKHGPLGYLKHTVLPSGVPVFMWPIIIPLEFFSNIIVRPMTLSLRLFANMFAGHLLVLVFVLGGEFLLLHTDSIVNKLAGVVAWIFSMAIFGLEIFVQSLQAFIFTVLTANYISSAAAEEH
jgi:F-type H+-transporting ATPase subunit a